METTKGKETGPSRTAMECAVDSYFTAHTDTKALVKLLRKQQKKMDNTAPGLTGYDKAKNCQDFNRLEGIIVLVKQLRHLTQVNY